MEMLRLKTAMPTRLSQAPAGSENIRPHEDRSKSIMRTKSSRSETRKLKTNSSIGLRDSSSFLLYVLLKALPRQLTKIRKFPNRYVPWKMSAERRSDCDTIRTPAIASANESQRRPVILSWSKTAAIIAVRTGMVRVMTEAFEARECWTPHVSPHCAGTTPSVPIISRPRRRDGENFCRVRFLPTPRNGAKRSVERASGTSAVATGPRLSVTTFAPENWKAHIAFTRTRTRKLVAGEAPPAVGRARAEGGAAGFDGASI